MINLALRDFQQKGKLSIGKSPKEPILLTGRSGPLFFLIPVDSENIENQYRELLKAMGQASLRQWHKKAEELGMDSITQDEINEEISNYRRSKRIKSK